MAISTAILICCTEKNKVNFNKYLVGSIQLYFFKYKDIFIWYKKR